MIHNLFAVRQLMAIALGAVAVAVAPVHADTVTVMIGDDDGFGGTQGLHAAPGSPYVTFSSPNILPGTYSDESALDATTASPFSPYKFIFNFSYDLSSFASISDAAVTVNSGSVARRNDGSGFGFATVVAIVESDSMDLGNLLGSFTGTSTSAAEESVKAHTFEVTTLISGRPIGTLAFTIDGSGLSSPVDEFSLDFAKLNVIAAPVPIPGAMLLLGSGPFLGFASVRRKQAATLLNSAPR